MRRTCVAVFVMMLFVSALALFAVEQANTEAIAPRLIKFSGALKDSSGSPRGGQVVISFALYASQEGGESLWRESQLIKLDDDGCYTVLLGASEKEGLPLELFSTGKAQWLGVQAEGEDEQARMVLVAVPYALKAADADTVGGKPISSFVLNEDLIKSGGDLNTYSVILQQRGIDGGEAAPDAATLSSGREEERMAPQRVFDRHSRTALTTVQNSTLTSFGDSAGTLGSYNSFYGAGAGNLNTGAGNSYFGWGTGRLNTTGNDNAIFGAGAGYNNTASSNSFFGQNAGNANTTGGGNSFFGRGSGSANTTGDDNSFFGRGSGSDNTSGYLNTFVGYAAGVWNTEEDDNTAIGAYSGPTPGITHATAVGYRAQVTRSNSLVLGSFTGGNGYYGPDTYVGIGTTAPDRQLVVEGDQALLRFRRYYGTADPFTKTFAPALLFERARGDRLSPADINAGDFLGKLQFRGRVGGDTPEYGAITFIASDKSQNGRFSFVDRDLVTERMVILNTGNVGIGTTTPSARLEIVGNLKITSGSILYGAEQEVPDYVFQPGYPLMPVEKLGDYIAAEKHLPNIPSAAEIKEKGLNLSEFQMKMLEKIEELTLYTVQQAKAIALKDAEIAALKANFETRLAAVEQQLKK